MVNELQVRYSNLVLQRLHASQVTKDNVIFNTRYEGNPVAGSVKIVSRADITVKDYDKANGLDGEQSATTYVDMAIDKDKAVNEIIDGYDAAAVPDGIVADRLTSAGVMLGETLDKDGLACLATDGTEHEEAETLTRGNVYDAIIDANTALTKANVPTTGRYLIINADVQGLLLKNSEFIRQSDLSQTILMTGAIGQIAGANVYVSNNLPDKVNFIMSHPDMASRANEWSVQIHIQDLGGSGKYIGACAVQGRLVYGHKVLNKAGVYVSKEATV